MMLNYIVKGKTYVDPAVAKIAPGFPTVLNGQYTGQEVHALLRRYYFLASGLFFSLQQYGGEC